MTSYTWKYDLGITRIWPTRNTTSHWFNSRSVSQLAAFMRAESVYVLPSIIQTVRLAMHLYEVHDGQGRELCPRTVEDFAVETRRSRRLKGLCSPDLGHDRALD